VNIYVCVKQVPDTEAHIRLNKQTGKLVEEEVNYIMNPYDEFALEEAVRIKENFPDVKVTVLSVGPPRVEKTLRDALARGADEAFRLWQNYWDALDPWTTAQILSNYIKDKEFDLILCGKKATDDDAGEVGSYLGVLLNIPVATRITKLLLDLENQKIQTTKEIEGGEETVEFPLPAVVTAEKGLNEPRYPSVKGLMKAKRTSIPCISPDFKPEPRVKIINLLHPPSKTQGKIFSQDKPPEKVVKIIVQELREQWKIL